MRKKNPPIPHAELNTLIAFNYLNINNDTALYFSNEAIRISEEDHVDTTLVKAYIIKCYALENLGEIDEALACNDTAIAQAEKFNRPRQLFSAYMIRGTLYRRKARYAEALDFYLKCTEIAEKITTKTSWPNHTACWVYFICHVVIWKSLNVFI